MQSREKNKRKEIVMKKHLIAAACSLAVLMTASPMIAACNPQTDDETAM